MYDERGKSDVWKAKASELCAAHRSIRQQLRRTSSQHHVSPQLKERRRRRRAKPAEPPAAHGEAGFLRKLSLLACRRTGCSSTRMTRPSTGPCWVWTPVGNNSVRVVI